MKKIYLVIGILTIFIASLVGLSFNEKQLEYLVVDGTTTEFPDKREAYYYYWDNDARQTVIIPNRYKLLTIAASDGWKLQSTYAYTGSYGYPRYETFIFVK